MRTRKPLLFIALLSLILAFSSAASAFAVAVPPENAGDIKIHEGAAEPDPVTKDEPHVCTFHLHGDAFSAGEDIEYWIDQNEPTGTANVLGTTTVKADENGHFVTGVYKDPPFVTGHYKLYWQAKAKGNPKHKVFWVSCGAPTQGTLSVFKYNDLNGNGSQDAGEAALSGWSFTVKDSHDKDVATGLTDEDGNALFDLDAGTYKVVETVQTGWMNTDPGGGSRTGLVVTAGQTTEVKFGNAQIKALTLTSMCSNDPTKTRAWRVRNPNPFDVPFTWEVYPNVQTGAGTAIKNSDVFFETNTIAGANTTKIYWSGGQTVKASSGAQCEEPVKGTLKVFKYNDLDGDGAYDAPDGSAGEPGLAGWAFTVTPAVLSVAPVSTNMLTGSDPLGYDSKDLLPGNYTICETLQAGWHNTDPSEGLCKPVTVTARETTTVMFGNELLPPPTADLTICKYNDVNANGVRDEGEPLLSGWQFTITHNERDLQSLVVDGSTVVTTGANGCVTKSLPYGDYTVTETTQPSWTNTDPGGTTPSKDVSLGGIVFDSVGIESFDHLGATLIFGNHYYSYIPEPKVGTLQVNKFNDFDRDGIKDAGEPMLAGFSFQVQSGGTTQLTITTNASGIATATLTPGIYAVVEIPKAGWTATTPINQQATITDGNTTVVTFGNATGILPPTTQTQLTILKYNDENANGVRDTDEGLLEGFSFRIRSSDGNVDQTITTAANGIATITNLPLGGYSVTEIAKSGYTNTDPGGNATEYFALATGSTSATLTFGNTAVKLPSTSTDPGTAGLALSLTLLGGIALMYVMARRSVRLS